MSQAEEQAPPADPQAPPPAEHPSAPPQEQAAPPAQAAPQQSIARADPPPPLGMDSDNVIELWRLAGFLAESELLPEKLTTAGTKRARNNVFLMMLVGKDRGLTPMQALSGGLHIIEGKVEIGSHAMVALVLKSGAAEFIRPVMELCDERQAVYETRRRDWPAGLVERYTFTIEDAALMGLLDKGKTDWAKANNNWRKQPKTMLLRRAASACCREFYPDVVLGLYDHGELQALDLQTSVAARSNRAAEEALSELEQAEDAEVVEEAPAKPVDPMAARIKARAERSRPPKAAAPAPNTGRCAACGTPDVELVGGVCTPCR